MTQDLPFWGFDRVVGGCEIVDLEGEVSNTAAIDILIRPTRQDLPDAFERIFAEVGGAQRGHARRGRARRPRRALPIVRHRRRRRRDGLRPGRAAGRRASGLTREENRDLARVYVGNGRYEVDRGAIILSREGDDVLVARDSAEGVAFFGGNNADGVEGGAGDDLLTAGGFDDERIVAPGAFHLNEAGERARSSRSPKS